MVLTIEDHSVVGGLGSAVAEILSAGDRTAPLRRIGYPDVFPSGYGTQDEMRARYGISVENIVNTVKELWDNS
jgi:transketolase C-terminal domain/subunit